MGHKTRVCEQSSRSHMSASKPADWPPAHHTTLSASNVCPSSSSTVQRPALQATELTRDSIHRRTPSSSIRLSSTSSTDAAQRERGK